MQIICMCNLSCNNAAMQTDSQFKTLLRQAGERITSPRLAVFRILTRHAPVSMAKLVAKAAEDGIDPVTVYRTIDLFRKLRLVQEVGFGRNRLFELSDDYHAHHHHFTCIECGTISDFDSAVIEADLKRIGEELGYAIRSHQLEVTGTCGRCR
jgi:Fe2+ or Zn2+ uptake regulation protein